MIDCALYGFLAADADNRTSKAGKPWTRLRVGVGRDDGLQWVSISAFGSTAAATAELRKGDKIYCEGVIKLDTWRGNDGIERHGLAVTAVKIERTHKIGRQRERKSKQAADSDVPETSTPDDMPSDEIPF